VFEAAEVGRIISKQEFEEREPQLRVDLINAQYDLQDAGFPVVILIGGDDRHGANEVLERLHEWMDARYMRTEVFERQTEEQAERPRFWRYWRVLPPRGRIGIYLGAWATRSIADHLDGKIGDKKLERRIAHVNRFERELIDDGALILKFWMHLPKKEFKKRLKKARKNPRKEWWADERDWQIYDVYDEAMPIVEQFLRATNGVPWLAVEGTDPRHRDLTVAESIRDAIVDRLKAESEPAMGGEPVSDSAPAKDSEGALARVDLSASLTREEYKKKLDRLQGQMARLSRKARNRGLSSVLVFEGWDAAGKGGVIRRITNAMEPRNYRIVPIAAPTDEEKARHYLWRFWRHLPRAGRMIVFDRSWCGRVLVERIEGFAQADEWGRSYDEIRDFEDQLVEHGMLLLKFWLHVDADEQLARFKAREQTPYKKYKITDEDYRNRERWDDYVAAVDEMVARTSTRQVPWHLLAANDKRHARIEALQTVVDAYKRALK